LGATQRQNVPAWAVQLFSAKNLDTQCAFAFTVNPFYLRGDFTGDGKPDIAILVKNKQSGKVGIAICHGGRNEVFFAGAGTLSGMAAMISVGWITWQVMRGRAPSRAHRRGFTDPKEQIWRRTDLLGQKKVQVATARRLSSRRSARARLLQRFRASISLRLLGRTHVGVGLDFAPLLFHDAAQFALHRFERVVNYLFQRFMGAVIHLLLIGHQFVPRRHGHVDTAPIRISLLMSVIGLLNGDIAAVDVIAKSLESCCIIQNEIVNLVRFLQTPIRYLNRQLHNYLDTTVLFTVEGTKISIPRQTFKSAAMSGNG
jgi:hypothetical protein